MAEANRKREYTQEEKDQIEALKREEIEAARAMRENAMNCRKFTRSGKLIN